MVLGILVLAEAIAMAVLFGVPHIVSQFFDIKAGPLKYCDWNLPTFVRSTAVSDKRIAT